MARLTVGTVFHVAGRPGTVDEFLGEGGQGAVYRAKWNDREWALKWYSPQFLETATGHRENIQRVVNLGAPTKRFLWPQAVATIHGQSEFGYIMQLRSPEYASLNSYVKRTVRTTFRNALRACYQLAESFRQLHLKGYSYADISRGNAFLHPGTGDILICDNDNVVPNGEAGVILGSGNFIAPEILRNLARPRIETDLHSLAVLMFQILFIAHPLDGKRLYAIRALDTPAREMLYAKEPIFVFDPANEANRPVAGSQDSLVRLWEHIYPTPIKSAFIKAFTNGLLEPSNRVRESEWIELFAHTIDEVVHCTGCMAEHIVDSTLLKESQPYEGTCWNCTQIIRLPFALKVGRRLTYLTAETRLHPHHIVPRGQPDFDHVIGEVRRHPTDRQVWGLANRSGGPWKLTTSTGTVEVPDGRSATLSAGSTITFGNGETGTIIA